MPTSGRSNRLTTDTGEVHWGPSPYQTIEDASQNTPSDVRVWLAIGRTDNRDVGSAEARIEVHVHPFVLHSGRRVLVNCR